MELSSNSIASTNVDPITNIEDHLVTDALLPTLMLMEPPSAPLLPDETGVAPQLLEVEEPEESASIPPSLTINIVSELLQKKQKCGRWTAEGN